jgi:predicted transcriptional regulator
VKTTLDIDEDLYGAIKVEAARIGRTVHEIIEDALEAWLVRAEEAVDRDSAAVALEEHGRDGSVAAESWYSALDAGLKSTNASDEV